jgi:hypothetical protein
MHVATLFAVSIVLFILFLFFFINFIKESDGSSFMVSIVLFCLLLLIASYIKTSYSMPAKISREIICDVYTIDNIQLIAYVYQNETDVKIINVNDQFNRKFDDGQKIKVIQYSTGPYKGLYWDAIDKYEIVEEDKQGK